MRALLGPAWRVPIPQSRAVEVAHGSGRGVKQLKQSVASVCLSALSLGFTSGYLF